MSLFIALLVPWASMAFPGLRGTAAAAQRSRASLSYGWLHSESTCTESGITVRVAAARCGPRR
jgi:hypothetical protein